MRIVTRIVAQIVEDISVRVLRIQMVLPFFMPGSFLLGGLPAAA